MKRLGKLLSSEWLLFSLFSTIIIIAGTIATPIRALQAHPGTMYDGTEFWSDDYSIYAGDILQGQRGRWTVIDKHTTEPHQGTLIHIEYLLWGKFTGLFGLDNLQAYQLGRVIFGFLLLFSLYSLLKMLLPKKIRLLAFFLILFSACFPIITKSPEGKTIISTHMEWFTEIDVFQRFTVLMHYLMGNMFFIVTLILTLKIFLNQKIHFRNKIISPLPFAIFSCISMVLTHPVSFIIFGGMISLYLFFYTIIRWTDSRFKLTVITNIIKEKGFPSFLLFIITTPILLYYRSQFTLPVWNQIAAWEGITQYVIPLKDYALTIGPTFFLAPFGFFALLMANKSQKLTKIASSNVLLIITSWILSFFLLFYFSYPFLTISQVRFMQNFIFIPFGIFAAIGIIFISNILSTVILKLKNIKNIIIGSILIGIVIICSPSYYRSMQLKLTIFHPNDPLMFPDILWVDAIRWLSKNSKPQEVVISAWQAGHAIPYLGGNTVYVGHFWATINRQEKEQKLYKFLDAQMTKKEMATFLKETTAKYLFFGYQEQYHGLKPDTIPFFKKIFDNTDVQIYKIENLDQ